MNLNGLNDNQIGYILNGLQVLMSHWHEFEQYDENDLMAICQTYITLKKNINDIIARMDNEPVPETLARQPNKGEGTVLGRPDYKKI
jgi:hypothetical protein